MKNKKHQKQMIHLKQQQQKVQYKAIFFTFNYLVKNKSPQCDYSFFRSAH